MEESEKRRERLKAMRMEADHGGENAESGVSGAPSSYGLSNPLVESENISSAPFQQAPRRFDYYTDPTSGYYGRKEATNAYPHASTPGQHSTHSRPPYQAMAPPPRYQYPQNSSPYQPMVHPPTYQSQALHAPRHAYPGNSMDPRSSWSRPWARPHTPPAGQGSAFNYRPPFNFSQGINFVRPRPIHGDSPRTMYNQGINQRDRTGPNGGGSGRGKGRMLENKTVPAKERPDLYYNRGMIEDPWKNLTPVLWKGPTPGIAGSWMPKSIASKKSKVSEETSKISLPQGSLAQYLAEAFNDSTEAVDD